jgi:hypothetical protein
MYIGEEMNQKEANEKLIWVANKSLEKSISPEYIHEFVWLLFNTGREYEAYVEKSKLDSFKESDKLIE